MWAYSKPCHKCGGVRYKYVLLDSGDSSRLDCERCGMSFFAEWGAKKQMRVQHVPVAKCPDEKRSRTYLAAAAIYYLSRPGLSVGLSSAELDRVHVRSGDRTNVAIIYELCGESWIAYTVVEGLPLVVQLWNADAEAAQGAMVMSPSCRWFVPLRFSERDKWIMTQSHPTSTVYRIPSFRVIDVEM